VDLAAIRRLSRALAPTERPVEALSEDGIAFLAIPIFSAGVPARVYSALHRFGLDHVRALILDLRGCPGGELVAALELASDFLDEGTLLVSAIDEDGDEICHRVRGARPHRFPLFLLVDRGTASAAEVFAGCLQAHGRALVLGETTHGKGSAQRLVPGLSEPGICYATVATFTLPNGEPIQDRGVRPDREVSPATAHEDARAAAASVLRPSNEER
jgi:carboxyl-terminal processing protease